METNKVLKIRLLLDKWSKSDQKLKKRQEQIEKAHMSLKATSNYV